MNSDAAHLKKEVTEAGFRPTPFPFLVWNIRRLIWPFIRQYHFFQLEKLAETQAHLDEALAQLARLAEEFGKFKAAQNEQASRFNFAHLELRSDLAAAINRLGRLTERLDGNALNEEIARLKVAQLELKADLAAIVGREGQLHERISGMVADQSIMKGEVEGFGDRQKLFPTSAEPGVFLLKAGDFVSDFVAKNHTWDEHIVPVIEDVGLTRKGLAIDVGAHLGLVSAVMARHFTRVVSFEPNTFNYRLLVANMSINRLANVECRNEALYSKPTTLSLGRPDQQEIFLPRDEQGKFDGLEAANLGAYTFTEGGTGLFTTEARTLDSYGFTDVAFIKIDAQGADGEVIRGAVETIRRCRPVIVFEWEKYLAANFAGSLEKTVQLLEGLDYQVDILKRTNDKQTDFLALPRARGVPSSQTRGGAEVNPPSSVSEGKEGALRA